MRFSSGGKFLERGRIYLAVGRSSANVRIDGPLQSELTEASELDQ